MVQVASQRPSATRLALCDRSTIAGAVDGAWWPNSSDLRVELPDLIAVLGLRIGPVRRIVYDPSFWMPAPSRIIRGTTVIAVDPYALVACDTIYLIGTHSRDAVLYVVPPTSPGDAVHRVLHAVSHADGPMSVAALRRLGSHYAAHVLDGPIRGAM
jgi:hypothetical protein